MNEILDRLGNIFPVLHATIFAVGISSNVALLFATFLKTPRTLRTYSIMIKFGTINDLLCICCDFFTMQRMLVVPGNLLYLSSGPCSIISARTCYLAYCMQLSTLVFSYYVMLASFAYRLYVLHRDPPKSRSVLIIMSVAFAFTFADADSAFVHQFLQEHAPKYLQEQGVLTGHYGITPQLIFTILFVIITPVPVYIGVIIIRRSILKKLHEYATEMSARTQKMHNNLVKALTIHAALPPITMIGVALYVVLFFDIYYHPTMEKAIYTIAAFPPALGAFCTLYYVEPYRQCLVLARPNNKHLILVSTLRKAEGIETSHTTTRF